MGDGLWGGGRNLVGKSAGRQGGRSQGGSPARDYVALCGKTVIRSLSQVAASGMAPHEKLRAWKASHELVLQIYRATESWPKREMYGLTAQARRAAFSVAANIAEGAVKRGQREFRRFLDIALGSSTELQYIIRLARDLGYLAESDGGKLEAGRNTAGKLLWRLYEAATKRKN